MVSCWHNSLNNWRVVGNWSMGNYCWCCIPQTNINNINFNVNACSFPTKCVRKLPEKNNNMIEWKIKSDIGYMFFCAAFPGHCISPNNIDLMLHRKHSPTRLGMHLDFVHLPPYAWPYEAYGAYGA